MANPSKAKGSRGENEIVDILVEAGFPRGDPEDPSDDGVKRYEGGHESHDIQGVGSWTIEVKYRKAWHLFAWIRRIRKRSWTPERELHGDLFRKHGMDPVVVPAGPDSRWAIFAIHGDRRTAEGREVGAVCIMDASMAAELIYHWETSS